MKKFLDQKHIITEIGTALLVPKGTGSSAHGNRKSHGFALNLEGTKEYIFNDDKVYSVGAGDLIYLPKGSSYKVKSVVPGDIYCINFQILDGANFSPFVFRPTDADSILKIYERAEKVWQRDAGDREYYVISALYKLLYEIRKQYLMPYLPERKKELINPAVEYIHKNYASELINVSKLGELCGISYDYLRKLFEKFYGVSLVKYINALKIKRAKELLSSGLYSVGEVALNSGFSDYSHFSRFFKENVGVLPSEYKNNR